MRSWKSLGYTSKIKPKASSNLSKPSSPRSAPSQTTCPSSARTSTPSPTSSAKLSPPQNLP
ncbi:hypothetical protein I7I51_04080 [Histoplasma capsulatum]|uniref:Uncharacterized protein n=1 Tax=Ajellomyces capsulatus TaxID=5037 RepID=A0A8A1MB06_AJECA|nr:hypothetical protein I7I51_04080 [Histoplasma capsulatum]